MFFVFLFLAAFDRLLKYFFLPGSFLIPSFIMMVPILFIFKFKKRSSNLFFFAVMLIFLGGLSNFYDRIFLGFVVDYLKIPFFPFVFNFSDIMITVGCIFTLWFLIK